jgi:hypothetical protein
LREAVLHLQKSVPHMDHRKDWAVVHVLKRKKAAQQEEVPVFAD